MAHRTFSYLLLGTLTSLAGLACSAAGAEGSGDGDGSGGASSGPPGGGGSNPGGGGDTSNPNGGSGPGTGGGFQNFGGSGGSLSEEEECFKTSSAAENVTTTRTVTVTKYSPVDMFIMYDKSGSMNDNTPAGSKWDAVKNALGGFMNNPSSADIGIGIGYFPGSPPACTSAGPNCACIPFINICFPTSGGSCNAGDYATPHVPIGILPAVTQQITDSVNAHNPGGGTPTAPALAGAHQYAATWAVDHPDRKTIVVLATDGEPSGCDNNSVQDVANIAAGALGAEPSVMTFVIGVGSSLTSLNSIASAGGSNQAIIVDAASGDATQQFIDAMNQIREAVTTTTEEEVVETEPVPCEWTIPDPSDGETFDPSKVNVEFVAGGGAGQLIGGVSSAADCANVNGGWHYDNASNPTKVLVCPQTCTTIQAVPDARIDVIFGCETEPAIVR